MKKNHQNGILQHFSSHLKTHTSLAQKKHINMIMSQLSFLIHSVEVE